MKKINCIHFIVPFGKFEPPYRGKATAAARAALLPCRVDVMGKKRATPAKG